MSDPSKKRGRKLNDELPPSRSRDVQRAFRARRAAHLANLENRNSWLEKEVDVLRARLGLLPGQYLTGPPPAEVEPDYDGVSEPSRVRGPNKRTLKKQDKVGAGQGSSKDLVWMGDLGSEEQGTLDCFESPTGGEFSTARSSSSEASPPLSATFAQQPLPTPPSFSAFPCPQQDQAGGAFNYGVYFVPKGSEQASYVGTTQFPSSSSSSAGPLHPSYDGREGRSSLPTPGQSSRTLNATFSISDSLRLLTSPDANSSNSSVSTAGPATPPDGWTNLREPPAPMKTESEVYHAFCRLLRRAFGNGQVNDTHGDDFPMKSHSIARSPSDGTTSTSMTDPLPIIRLPRFASGLPGSTHSTAPSTDNYLHVSKAFERFQSYLVGHPSSSSPTRRVSPVQLVDMLQAQEQQSLLSSQPESFDFARPPTCLFLPPFSAPSCQPVLSRKETYVLAHAVEQVRQELDMGKPGRYFA